MTRRASAPQRLGDVLARYLSRAGLVERVRQAAVVDEWPALVGERIARHAEAVLVRPDGVLLVRVRSASWAQELTLMTPDILARINAGRAAGRIRGIHWTVARD